MRIVIGSRTLCVCMLLCPGINFRSDLPLSHDMNVWVLWLKDNNYNRFLTIQFGYKLVFYVFGRQWAVENLEEDVRRSPPVSSGLKSRTSSSVLRHEDQPLYNNSIGNLTQQCVYLVCVSNCVSDKEVLRPVRTYKWIHWIYIRSLPNQSALNHFECICTSNTDTL